MFHDDLLPLYINFIDISLRFERPPTSIQPLQNTIYRHSCFCPILSSFYISLKAFDQSFVAKKKTPNTNTIPTKGNDIGSMAKTELRVFGYDRNIEQFCCIFLHFFLTQIFICLVNECIFIKWEKLSYSVTHIHNSYIHTYTLRHTHPYRDIESFANALSKQKYQVPQDRMRGEETIFWSRVLIFDIRYKRSESCVL